MQMTNDSNLEVSGVAQPEASLVVRLAVTALWLLALVPFVGLWEVTQDIGGLMLWSLGAVGLLFVTRRSIGAGAATARSAFPWLLGIGLAWLGCLGLPSIPMAGQSVPTTALIDVADLVVPIWIAVRALKAVWAGAWITLPIVPVWLLLLLWGLTVQMPGASFGGALPALSAQELQLKASLEAHIQVLSEDIGPRGLEDHESLREARDYIEGTLASFGYSPQIQPFVVDGIEYWNVEATRRGAASADEIVVFGAHYDVCGSRPGADDNATGVAALLELARVAIDVDFDRSLRFVFFANEEPPFFGTEDMGSRVYARASAEAGEDIVSMFSLESIGYYLDEPGSQKYPFPFGLFYPDRGDFIAFVGNPSSRPLVRESIETFRDSTLFPSQGCVAPSFIPGVFWSDHASFWKEGYSAIMITDTAPFRNENYHQHTDTLDTLDMDRMARVVKGLEHVMLDSATAQTK
jgi:hypothetical protein